MKLNTVSRYYVYIATDSAWLNWQGRLTMSFNGAKDHLSPEAAHAAACEYTDAHEVQALVFKLV